MAALEGKIRELSSPYNTSRVADKIKNTVMVCFINTPISSYILTTLNLNKLLYIPLPCLLTLK